MCSYNLFHYIKKKKLKNPAMLFHVQVINFFHGPKHPAGDVTRVFLVPGKVTVKIGDAENRWRGCRDKN